MLQVPSYVKISHVSGSAAKDAFIGDEIIIQEKVDGSQFDFGWNENMELVARSKGKNQDLDAPDKMFNNACTTIQSIKYRPPADTYFYCEYLEKPKHNVLCYDHIPTGGLVLFDVLLPGGQFLGKERSALENYAAQLGIDVIPELYRGAVDLDLLLEIVADNDSYLGREKIEGVVCKNYDQAVNMYGHIFPTMVKYVREAFKERHGREWKSGGDHTSSRLNATTFIQSFRAEPRWQKAIIHARELSQLVGEPKDIGPLVKLIQQDIREEETDTIKNTLYKLFIDDILRTAIAGFPEFYKRKLLEDAFQEQNSK